MSQKQNLGYDFTKKMLNTMRNLNENVQSKKVLKEEESQEMFNLVLNDNVEVKIHSTDQEDLSLSDEEKNSLNQLIQNFKSQVSELANFEEGFNIYVDNVRLDGSIEEDLGFVFIAGNNGGLYINANMLKIEQDTVEIISKLEKFKHSFDDVVIEIMNNRKNN
jgi:ribonuclease HII